MPGDFGHTSASAHKIPRSTFRPSRNETDNALPTPRSTVSIRSTSSLLRFFCMVIGVHASLYFFVVVRNHCVPMLILLR